MYMLKRVIGLLSLALLVGLMLSIGASPVVEAGGKSNHIGSNFAMVENLALTPPTDASGSGKLSFNTKKGEFDLTVQAQGLEPGVLYHVRQTIRNGTAGDVPALATLFDVGVVADSNGEIKVTRKHVSLEILNIDGIDEDGPWRIDQQITRAGVGNASGNCEDCVLVCRPTTKISLVDGQLVEGWLP